MSYPELMRSAQAVQPLNIPMQTYLVVGLRYVLFSFGLSQLPRRLNRKPALGG